MPSFDRGFKSWAERCSVGLRRDLGLKAHDPLPAASLAEYLEIRLWTPRHVTGLPNECLEQLLKKDPKGWSAITFSSGDGYTIIYNPCHSQGRQSSDIMHELAHIIAGHEPSQLVLSSDGKMVMRSFDQKREDEAFWLSGCLLLPREALLYIKRIGFSESQIQERYVVTSALLRCRLGVSGVSRQLSWRAGSRAVLTK